MKLLIHYTDAISLWSILETRKFIVPNEFQGSYNYDWGMNFASRRGKLSNYNIPNKNCQIKCYWDGEVSPLLPYEHLNKKPNTLYNYDYEANNDARYLLTVGSQPFVIDFIFDDEEEKFTSWLNLKSCNASFIIRPLYENNFLTKIFKQYLKSQMEKHLKELKLQASDLKLIIKIGNN